MVGRLIKVAMAGVLLFTLAGTTNAVAKGGNDVIRRGSCSGSSDWKLKLSPEDGRIEVEYEVDSNKVGQHWRGKLYEKGEPNFPGTKNHPGAGGPFPLPPPGQKKGRPRTLPAPPPPPGGGGGG